MSSEPRNFFIPISGKEKPIIVQELPEDNILDASVNAAFEKSEHNSLQGVQGGSENERYHITKKQSEALNAATTASDSNRFLTKTDILKFVKLNDNVQSATTTWSSQKIVEFIYAVLNGVVLPPIEPEEPEEPEEPQEPEEPIEPEPEPEEPIDPPVDPPVDPPIETPFPYEMPIDFGVIPEEPVDPTLPDEEDFPYELPIDYGVVEEISGDTLPSKLPFKLYNKIVIIPEPVTNSKLPGVLPFKIS